MSEDDVHQGASAEVPQSLVVAICLKHPSFWPNDPALWCVQVEVQFLTWHVTTQDIRFTDVVGSLQPEVVQKVWDLLIAPLA